MKGHWRSIQCPHECIRICTDYVITLPMSLSSHYILYVCACVCLLSCPSDLYVNVGRVHHYEEEKNEKKKSFVVRYRLDS
jgi:hypothetical protein